MRTYSPKPGDTEKKWYVIDATGVVLGRLASQVAALLRGKHKPTFAPHMDQGDYVVVINADKVVLTGNKLDQKMAYHHSGYPGGLRATSYRQMLAEHPERVVEIAVKGMLPHCMCTQAASIRMPARRQRNSKSPRSPSERVALLSPRTALRRTVADTTQIEELDEETVPSSYTTETATAPQGAGQSVTAPGAGLGRRKEAVARVRLIPGTGQWKVNGRTLEDYFPNKLHQQLVKSPFTLLDLDGRFDVIARINGGGISGQAGALRLGIARALNEIDREANRPALKKAGFLTRDARATERKKAGLKKARKAPQYSKR